MKTHTHTPGPWLARQSGGSHVSIEKISDGIRSVIAETYYFKLAEEHGGGYSANARLIAAAPDLLAALVDMVEQFGHYCEHTEDEKEIQTLIMARAAISKAEGRE